MISKKHYFIVFIGIIILIVGIFLGLSIKKEEKKEVVVNAEDVEERKINAIFVAIDDESRGVALDLITEVKPGNGQVLVNINNVLADITTQYSARVAASVASKITGVDLSKLDVFYNMITNASIVAGGSAGSVMAVTTIAALENKDIKKDVVVTGSIDEDGNIVSAGGVLEKAGAAKSRGAKLFLVPKDSGEASGYTRKTECTKFNDVEYCEVKHISNLTNFDNNIGIEIKYVENVEEALKYFYA